MINEIKLSGKIIKLYPLKLTPAGIRITRFVLAHKSVQIESSYEVSVKCTMFCIWVNHEMHELAVNADVIVQGFVSHNARLQLVLHITKFLDKGS